jgi:ATP-dependent protease ClpP protease subunit
MEMIMQSQNRTIDEMKLNAYINERTIYLNDDEIGEDTEFIVNRMFERIIERDKKANIKPQDAEPITLKISTYGGNLYATLSIISQIEYLRDLGYWIIGIGYGKIMSGGFKILIACSERWCQRHSRLLYHQVQSFEMGRTSVESDRRRLKDMEEMWRRCQDIILKYTNITQEHLDIITREDRDIYVWVEEALNLNIIDKIL